MKTSLLHLIGFAHLDLRRHKFLRLQFSAVCLALLLGATAQAVETLPLYEPFPYGEGEQFGLATSSGTNWDNGNSVSSSCARIAAIAAQSFPGLPADTNSPARGLMSRPAGTGTKNRGATFTAVTNGTLYASFLLYPTNRPAANYLFFGLGWTNNSPSAGASVWLTPAGQLVISKNSTAAPAASTNYTSFANSTYPLVLSNAYLVVLRYKFNPGTTNDDEVALWLDPGPLGNDAAIPAPLLSTTNGLDIATLQNLCYFQTAPLPGFYLDEIRVATNWAGVTPNPCAPGAVFSMTGGGSNCLATGYTVGLSGSESGVDYWLWTNGVFSGQVASSNGSPITFGTQTTTAFYTASASNTTSSCFYWMSGVAGVGLLRPPAIQTQPVAAAVATNGSCTFSVVATGDGLVYHWRRNGINLTDGTNIFGSATPNLTIYPATAAEGAITANGYDVAITGMCTPSTNSARVALTVQPAANLGWLGDGSSNPWDVGTSADWFNGVSTTVFNFGDNVTFPDGLNNIVSLANNYLSPSLITMTNSGTNYVFSGSGRVNGGGTKLLLAGPGTLTLNNSANTFGGGITISNGQLSFNAGAQLGTNLITLSGGALDALNVAGITVGNPIFVTANSSINVHNTSTSALIINNTLDGNGGTLRFVNSTSSRGPTIQLTHTNFTFNRPIVLDLGATGTNLVFSCNNGLGSQIYNGVISDSASANASSATVRRNGTGGSMILNAQNTYSSGTELSSGSIGIGVDSVSAFPPMIDSGPLGTGTLMIDTGGAAPGLFASGGAHTVGNAVVWTDTNLGTALRITGSNALTFTGTWDLSGTNRTIQADNSGLTTIAGVIGDSGLAFGLTKTGTNILVLAVTNTYTGPTVISNGTLRVNAQIDVGDVTVATNGTLGGTGVVLGQVTVDAGGALAPGASVGTLTLNSNVTLAGNLAIEVNKSLSPSLSNDFIVVNGTLTNTGVGAVVVANLGPALVPGDRFTLFNQPLINGGAMHVAGAGVKWTNNLAVDGSIAVVSGSIPTTPVVINKLSVAETNLFLGGTNGYAGGVYYLLSSPNITTPRSSWFRSPVSYFDSSGNFSFTNTFSPATPQMFFQVLVP